MKTPKQFRPSPGEKLNKSTGGIAKKKTPAKKMSLRATKHAADALNDSSSFKNVKTPLKGKKSVGGSPKSNGVSPAKGKKSMGGTPGPKANGVTPKKSPRTPKNANRSPKTPKNANQSPEVKLGLNIEKLLESPKTTKGPKNNKKANKKPQGEKVKLAKPSATPAAPFLNRDSVMNAVKALIETAKSEAPEGKKDILDNRSVFLFNVNFFKVPSVKRGVIRATLPFPFHDSPDVALIVRDLDKKKSSDPDDTIDHYKQLMSKYGIEGITEIIPYKKLRTDYTQFEQKRKLVNRFDIILVDGKIAHRVPTLMQKSIIKNKNLIPVRLDKLPKLKKVISDGLKKITMYLHRRGLSMTTRFGHADMELNHLVDNVFAISRVFQEVNTFTQGVNNLRSVSVKTPKGVALPVYISDINPNDVKQEIIKKGPKSEPVTGELTTAENTMVTVFPDGKVVTKKIKSKKELQNEKKKKEMEKAKEDSEDELVLENTDGDIQAKDSDDDDLSDLDLSIGSDDDIDDFDIDDDDIESDDDDENEEPKMPKGKKALKDAGSDDESSGDEEEIEAAEQEFLQALRQQQDDITKKRKLDNKQKPKKGAAEEKENAKKPKFVKGGAKAGAQPGKKFNKNASPNNKKNASPNNKSNVKRYGDKPYADSPKTRFGGKPNNKNSPKNKPNGKKFSPRGGKGKAAA